MDAGKVGDRKDMTGLFRPRTLEEKMVADGGLWESNYYEPQRWIDDMANLGYSHVGTYKVDDDSELYRFELDESRRAGIPVGRTWECHFQNVLMHPSLAEHTRKVNEHCEMMRRIREKAEKAEAEALESRKKRGLA